MSNPKLDTKQTALAFGTFAAVLHAAWAVLVAADKAAALKDWITGLHFISTGATILPFNTTTAAMLIVVTFVVGYIVGHVFASIWNWAAKK